ncbi:MAG TPA: sigma-70 family RNA polymerase sigma factor [Verrucomicrobiae bacterium]|jgi:RNA polymerase sigma-70 factor (ECF subfamily)|nr:sigma-70 family RNA polymerase sigma factor [Verrucomicrobiae bacterium]
MGDEAQLNEPLRSGDSGLAAEKTMRVQQLFVKHQLGLRAFILSLEPNFTDAEDLLQEVFLVVTRKANEFQEGTNFFAWACTIARYKLLELLRRRARSQALSEEVIEALCAVETEHAFDDSRVAILQQCLEQLAPKARQMMFLRYYGEHSPAQIARLVSWTPNAVRVALSRARTVLQECLERRMRKEAAR